MCKGKVEKITTRISRRAGSKRISIKNVPVEICLDCGDIYIDDTEIEIIDKIIDKARDTFGDFTIVNFNDYI
jgi:YgiT-type zinc finger domain-containing protein